MQWKILDTGTQSAVENMALDAYLLEHLDQETDPILHLYDWEGPSGTYGHFIKPSQHLNLEAATSLGLSLAKRPTGGGILFHTCDLAFSMLVPVSCHAFSVNTLDNYHFVNKIVISAIKAFLEGAITPTLLPSNPPSCKTACLKFCMAKPTIYDVVIDGQKVGGGAQRKTKKGFLHQGTISLTLPSMEFLEKILGQDSPVIEAMLKESHPLLGREASLDQLTSARSKLKASLIEHLSIDL